MRRTLILIVTHGLVGLGGFALGIYLLPILIAPSAPPVSEVQAMSASAMFSGTFRRDLKDSDALHWGEGTVFIGPDAVTFEGELSPGPDYKLYLSPEFVETEARFNELKPRMMRVGDVRTFENFIVPLPAGIDPQDYSAVIVWCETFGQFITAATYR